VLWPGTRKMVFAPINVQVKPCRLTRSLSLDVRPLDILAESNAKAHNSSMIEKQMVLEAIRELPDDASLRVIADRVEFLAAIQAGLDQLDRGETIPYEEIKKQLASWLTN